MKDSNPNMFDDLITDLKKSSKALVKVASEARNDIIKRTQQGIDVNSVAFKAYSKGYKAFKGKTRPNDPVNLTYFGHMLKGMKVREESYGAKIYYLDQAELEKAEYHCLKGAGKSKVIRDYFGLTAFEVDKAFKSYKGDVLIW